MVIVDTSVWIRSLANRTPYAAELSRLLDLDQVAGHDLIYGELLIGGPKGRAVVLKSYALLRQIDVVPHAEVVEFIRAHKLHGQGIGWIDAHLLAAAIANNVTLWTADQHLLKMANRFGAGHTNGLSGNIH